MSIHLVDELSRGAVRILLAASTIGFGASGWILIAYHRWQAAVALLMWVAIGVAAFLSIWNEERDR